MLIAVNLVCALLSYSLLAYALARLRWHGRGISFVLVAIFISAQVWLIPQLISTLVLGANATLYWIWFADWLVCAFGVVLLWYSFKDTSSDCADAARIDGCGPFGVYWHVVLPLVRRTLLLLAIFTLMASGGAFLARASEQRQVGPQHISLTFLFASSAIMMLPLILIFFLAERSLYNPSGRKDFSSD